MDADVADQQQAATGQCHRAATRSGVAAVGIEATGDRLSAFLKLHLQIALHQAQPVGVDQSLVLGIDGGDRILAVLDGRHGRLEYHVVHAGRMSRSDGVFAIDGDLDMQSVVSQQYARRRLRRAIEPGQPLRVGQTGGCSTREFDNQLVYAVDQIEPITHRVGMAGVGQGHVLVQQRSGMSHHAGPAGRIVPRCRLPLLPSKHVGTVERIVEAAPASIGGVQAVPGIVDGNNQLGSGDRGDFRIDIGRFNGEGAFIVNQVPDLGQEITGLLAGETGLLTIGVPGVDLLLQFVTAVQQPTVARL
ncbi:MAG: hypothetical protein CM1200mP2_39450 [Planctomycetaceae bacterium]|nr:MAG: hypothetical protein CM1200mP2_39450 [Planctomycetaceae bacterium]